MPTVCLIHLVALIGVYEAERYPIAVANPIVAIKFRMEQQNLTQRGSERIIGASAGFQRC